MVNSATFWKWVVSCFRKYVQYGFNLHRSIILSQAHFQPCDICVHALLKFPYVLFVCLHQHLFDGCFYKISYDNTQISCHKELRKSLHTFCSIQMMKLIEISKFYVSVLSYQISFTNICLRMKSNLVQPKCFAAFRLRLQNYSNWGVLEKI